MVSFEDLIVSPREALGAAMRRMTTNHKGVLFVCEPPHHLVGVVADGDVRRAIVGGTLMVAPVSQVMNLDPAAARSEDEARALVRQRSFVAVPVLDGEGRIVRLVVDTGDDDVVVLSPGQPGDDVDAEEADPRPGVGAVAVIPARGDSRRIPGKNLARVGGRSLLARAVDAARQAHHVGHVVVSTDDDEIAAAARKAGADVPWMRPEALAGAEVPAADVLLHAVEWAREALGGAEFGVYLEPTAPARTPHHIDQALELLLDSDADAVVSVSEVPHVLNPEELLVIDGGVLTPYVEGRTMDTRRLRGQQRPAYVQNGLVYAFRMASVLEHGSLYGHTTLPLLTGWGDFLDVDTPEDLEYAEYVLGRVDRR